MNKKVTIALSLVTAAGIVGATWVLSHGDLHKHGWVRVTDASGETYWTCPMHPQIHLDHPGSCPICGMNLIEKQQTAAPVTPVRQQAEKKVLYWYDPMVPQQHFDKPGKSPFMDMELVPKYADPVDAKAGGTIVQIDPSMAQNLGMRTARVRAGDITQGVTAVGMVAIDENRIVAVTSRAAGWVEQLNVRAVGDAVRRGQAIAGIYSPDLLAAQQELALARKLDDPSLIEASRQRLNLLGVGSSKSPQRRVMISAPQAGVVTELMVREGAQVTPGTPLMMLADLSQVWIVVDVPEAQAGALKVGEPAKATLKSDPATVRQGKVEYIYPMVDTQTRTLKARLSFPNHDGSLKPGMYAQVFLNGPARMQVTLVPSEAVIRTGTRNVVMLAEAMGRYRPVEVRLGNEQGNDIEVLDGLEPGQEVVVSGQFLLDSEASLLGAYQRADSAKANGDEP